MRPGGDHASSARSSADLAACPVRALAAEQVDLTLAYEALQIPNSAGLALFGYTAEPGSTPEDALELLASWAATGPDSATPLERE